MIKIDHMETYGWEAAIRGMRNPMNSWDKSDSYYDADGNYIIGENDLALMKKLVHAGSDHRKFLRQIMVSMDITAPLYWWKEFDTYKVGTVANSCSTMHKIHEKDLTREDFSCDQMDEWGLANLDRTIRCLNTDRRMYVDYDNIVGSKMPKKHYWYQMIQTLPSSYNQMRTVTMTYENLLNMYRARKDHKLDEWRKFCDTIAHLPYFKEVIGCES
jgi:hypothetical protein